MTEKADSPTEAMAVNDAMPMATPSIMKKLRNGLRASVRSARAIMRIIFMRSCTRYRVIN